MKYQPFFYKNRRESPKGLAKLKNFLTGKKEYPTKVFTCKTFVGEEP